MSNFTYSLVKSPEVITGKNVYHGVIDGTNDFRICGIDLTVPDGDDESLTFVKKDGVTKVADITVSETKDGQRITCHLSGNTEAIPKGTYKVRLASHGLDPTAPLTVVTKTVTLVEAIPAPEPEPIAETSDGSVKVMTFKDGESSTEFICGHDWVATGVGLSVTYDPEGTVFYVDHAFLHGPGAMSVPLELSASADKTRLILAVSSSELGKGRYENCSIDMELRRGEETEELQLPVGALIVE